VPSEGTLYFGEQRLDGADESALTAYRREHVGFVFQFYNLIPSLTVRENVALVTDIARNPLPVDEAGGAGGLGRAGRSLTGLGRCADQKRQSPPQPQASGKARS
jgi:predicted ABC-type transport system involved in lysophospholipase L1 biosynthesis ATPase subunit